MLIKHMQKALIAAMIITGPSSVAVADPAPSSMKKPYQLKVDTSAELNKKAYLLNKKFRQPIKAAGKKETGIEHTAILVSSTPENVVAKFTTSDKLASQPFSREIAVAAAAASLDPALVHAVIFVESRYRQNAVSPKGAIGLMQLLPDTAARYGIKDPGHSPQLNIKAGTLYLRDLLRMFDNRMDLALAAYNAGEGAVLRYARQIPPYRETQMYVRAVLAKYNEWQNVQHPAQKLRSDAVTAIDEIADVGPPPVEYLAGTRLSLSDSPVVSTNY
jgi:soluble lytic murein transglycosylase-like protein